MVRSLIMLRLRALILPSVLLVIACTLPHARPPGAPSEPGLAGILMGQSIMGGFLGTAGAVLGGLAGYVILPPCVMESASAEAPPRAAAMLACSEFGLLGGVALGAVAGSAGAIYMVGRGGGREGSFLATAGGAAAGLAAGVAFVSHARPPVEAAFVLVGGATLVAGISAYHFTDRVRLRASPLPPERGFRPDGAAFRIELALR